MATAVGTVGQTTEQSRIWSWMTTVDHKKIAALYGVTGFTFFLKDDIGRGHAELLAARNQLLGMAAQSPLLTAVREAGGRAVAVANAHPSVRAAAGETTSGHDADGVARYLEAVLANV